MRRLELTWATVLGIGTGVALSASLGSAGYAAGLGIGFGILGLQRLRNQRD
jgi:hypothetical protein